MILLRLYFEFFKTGLFAVGGGLATIPFLREISATTGWFTDTDLTTMIAVSESTPGPFAINMATFVGNQVGGVLGSAMATLGVVLPSFIIILIVIKIYDQFRKSKLVKGAMSGLKPAVVGLIANAILGVFITVFFPAGWSLAVFTSPAFYVSLGIFLVMLLLAFKKLHPILVIVLSAVLGIIFGYAGLL